MLYSVLIFTACGLMVGSFLNVLFARLPAGETVIMGRSHCPHCRVVIAWYDLVPVASYFMLAGRCRNCSAPIHPRYLLVEVLTALGFAAAAFFAPSLVLAGWLAVLWALTVFIAVYDVQTLIIPNVAVVFFTLWAAVGLLVFWRDTIEAGVLSGLGYLGFFLLLFLISRGHWIGGGDVKLALGIGLWLGWPAVATALMSTYLIGGVLALALLALRRVRPQTQIPFGPLLLVGGWVAFLFSPELITWYLSLLV